MPDARLDDSSTIEAGLIAHGQPYLAPLWHNAHWRLFRFTGYHGLVDGPARLQSIANDSFTLEVFGTGTVTVHIHDSPRWAVRAGGCTATSPDGWTELRGLGIGRVRVVQALHGTRCDHDTWLPEPARRLSRAREVIDQLFGPCGS